MRSRGSGRTKKGNELVDVSKLLAAYSEAILTPEYPRRVSTRNPTSSSTLSSTSSTKLTTMLTTKTRNSCFLSLFLMVKVLRTRCRKYCVVSSTRRRPRTRLSGQRKTLSRTRTITRIRLIVNLRFNLCGYGLRGLSRIWSRGDLAPAHLFIQESPNLVITFNSPQCPILTGISTRMTVI